MRKRKVLVVEDMDSIHRKFERELGEEVELLKALTLEEGQELFIANPDVFAVVMDACVPGQSPNSQWLVREIRKTFSGPMIAISGASVYRKELLKAGCDYECPKDNVPQKIRELVRTL